MTPLETAALNNCNAFVASRPLFRIVVCEPVQCTSFSLCPSLSLMMVVSLRGPAPVAGISRMPQCNSRRVSTGSCISALSSCQIRCSTSIQGCTNARTGFSPSSSSSSQMMEGGCTFGQGCQATMSHDSWQGRQAKITEQAVSIY